MDACRRFVVAGRVQGVAYRAWTKALAGRLNLRGWARNLPDGRVEVVARGDPASIEALRAALGAGPPAARVSAVEETALDASTLVLSAVVPRDAANNADFEIR